MPTVKSSGTSMTNQSRLLAEVWYKLWRDLLSMQCWDWSLFKLSLLCLYIIYSSTWSTSSLSGCHHCLPQLWTWGRCLHEEARGVCHSKAALSIKSLWPQAISKLCYWQLAEEDEFVEMDTELCVYSGSGANSWLCWWYCSCHMKHCNASQD